MLHHALRWFFQNRQTGEITIAQWPNTILWIVLVVTILRWSWSFPSAAHSALGVILKVSLCLWALDELARGVNPWRRCLGAAVLLYQLFYLIHSQL